MIELPDASFIAGLQNAHYMTESILALIFAVLPRSSLDKAVDARFDASYLAIGYNSNSFQTQASSDETSRDDNYNRLRPALSYKWVKLNPNMENSADCVEVSIPQHAIRAFVLGRDEKYQPTAPSVLYHNSLNDNKDLHNALNDEHYLAYQHTQAFGKADYPPLTYYRSNRN